MRPVCPDGFWAVRMLFAPCFSTFEVICLESEEFRQLAAEKTTAYAEDPAIQLQWGLEAIRAPEAYAHLELNFGPDTPPGKGVLVGVLDTGIDPGHPAFRNKNIIERFTPGASDEDGSEFSHGTAVASVIAGEDDPDWAPDAPGVAWGADLVMFALPLGDAPELYNPITLDALPGTSEYFAGTVDEILSWSYGGRGIDFLNLSLGVSGVIDNFSEAELREHFSAATATFAQADSDEKVVLVWAAGNAHETPCDSPVVECVDGAVDAVSPGLLSGLAARLPELREHTVSVVAIGQDGEITDFSNRCGIAAEYCLAAPGEDVRVAYFGPFSDGPGRGIATARGTSFAAPMVTGSLALMKQYFRGQLSNTDLLARLLETADRSGPYADAEIYGRGLMDLGTATSPVGAETVVVSGRVNGRAPRFSKRALNSARPSVIRSRCRWPGARWSRSIHSARRSGTRPGTSRRWRPDLLRPCGSGNSSTGGSRLRTARRKTLRRFSCSANSRSPAGPPRSCASRIPRVLPRCVRAISGLSIRALS